MKSILIAEGMHKGGIKILKRKGFKIYEPNESFNPSDINIIIVRSVFQINKNSLKTYPNLKLVAKLGTGLDNIDLSLCKRKKIEVINAPGMNAISTAEFTITQILNIYKNSFIIHNSVKKLDYRRNIYYGHELNDATVGIIGYGSVGRNIAVRMKHLVNRVIIRDKYQKHNITCDKFEFVLDLKTLIKESDIIIIAVSLSDNTKFVNNDFLSHVKKDVLITNTARGYVVNEPHLINFLKKNKKAFYYCDVLENEPQYGKYPQDYKNPLLDLPNVMFTPHIAGMTKECQEKIAINIAKTIINK